MEADQSCVLRLKISVDCQVAHVPQISLPGEVEVPVRIAVCDDEEPLDGPVATISGSLHSLHLTVDLAAGEQ